MNLTRFLSLVAIFVILGILFVWQQTEIFRLGYENYATSKYFEELLDENRLLSYNLNKLSSLNNLTKSENDNLYFPQTFQLVKLPILEKERINQNATPLNNEADNLVFSHLGTRLLWPLAWAEEFFDKK